MRIVLLIVAQLLCCFGGVILLAQDTDKSGQQGEIPILHHYDDPAREVWEITFDGRKYVDSDVERPIADFRFSSLENHVKGGSSVMPVLFVLKVPRENDLALFGDIFIKILKEANKVSLPYSVCFYLPDRNDAQILRTSALPPDVLLVVLRANGDFILEGKSFTGPQLKAALLSGKKDFHSHDLRIEFEIGSMQSLDAWLQLYDLLYVLNQTEPNGSPRFRYSVAIQMNE